MLKRISRALYERISLNYPSVMRMYEGYKNLNPDFHRGHRFRSLLYLFRLINAERRSTSLYSVPFPHGSSKGSDTEDVTFDTKSNFDIPDRMSVSELADILDGYDVVSFDVFDTLIFRPFAKPEDLFYLVGARLGYFGFREIRIDAERYARANSEKPNFEINIYDIYSELARRTGLSRSDAELEIATEVELCYANPYMLELFAILRARGKNTVIVSDMYLPTSVIEEILNKNGFCGYKKLYVSCEYGRSKSTGQLFKTVKREFGSSIIHIGDNYASDVLGAERAGIKAYYYKRCSEIGKERRPTEPMSEFSSMYAGIVNNALYNGIKSMSERESFAFSYAGAIAVGFCEWINTFCKTHGLEKILFLSRDMSSVYKVYNSHYKEYENSYVITSRFSLQELIVADYPEEYFFHTVKARCDRGYTLKRTLCELNLEFLASSLKKYGLNEHDRVSSDKISKIKELFINNKERIAEHFSANERAARAYFSEIVGDKRKICIADLGWRGSIIAYLKFLLVNRWKLCDEVMGVLIASSADSSAVELISEGTVTPYLYSHAHNRELLISSDWNREFIRIMTLEAVFTSGESSLIEYKSKEDGGYEFTFGAENLNAPIINEFSRGIERFADELESARGSFRSLYPISAAVSFSPMHSVLESYEYIARIIGDVVDTPYALAGLGIKADEYVPLGELLAKRNLIKSWPVSKK